MNRHCRDTRVTSVGIHHKQQRYSVVVHFEDTAFDDAHVSVPHNLMSVVEREAQTKSDAVRSREMEQTEKL